MNLRDRALVSLLSVALIGLSIAALAPTLQSATGDEEPSVPVVPSSDRYVEGVLGTDTVDTCYQRGARCAVANDFDEFLYIPEEWGYDGAAVRQALIDFNRQCAEGAPDPTRRFDAVAIDRPPFYVIETVPAITFTFGGLLIDEDARVLDGDGQPIPGLLAAGADAGGLYVRAYAGGLAAALVFGLRAARTALERAAAVSR